MRLIDADRLLKPCFTNIFDEPVEMFMFSRYAIESQPVVDAIPVAWMRDYVSHWVSEAYKNFVLNMIKNWEKENEKDI